MKSKVFTSTNDHALELYIKKKLTRKKTIAVREYQ